MRHDPRFEPEFASALAHLFEELIPFNRFIGFKVFDLGEASVRCRYHTRPELIGDFSRHVLHGGVVAAAMDSMAGLGIMVEISRLTLELPWRDRLRQFQRMGTIDLRTDYLEPAKGPYFDVEATVMRVGKRIASVRVDTRDHEGKHIAAATAAFMVGWHKPAHK